MLQCLAYRNIWGKTKTYLLSTFSNSSKVQLQPCNFLTHIKLKSGMTVARPKMFHLGF